jgi:diguanylate cyclase
MSLMRRLVELLRGTEPRMRRMLRYWAATCVLYLACIALILAQVALGMTEPEPAYLLIGYGCPGVIAFYLLIRASTRIGLKPDQLAVLQAVFSLVCGLCAYAISGPLRGAVLSVTVVTIVFCMFAARPRQTLMLSIAALAGAGGLMFWLQAHDPVRFPPMTELLTFFYLATAMLATALLTGEMSKLRARLKRQRQELSEALETIQVLATVDELTSLVNRRRMHELLEEQERRQICGGGTCIALIDIDFFKQVNDRFGHAGGDAVLRGFSLAARASLRTDDVLARWGGEEFLLLLPGATPDEARAVLERMAERVRDMSLPALQGARISFSAGLARRRDGEPFAEAIHRADKALYRAKEAGRNQIVMA